MEQDHSAVLLERRMARGRGRRWARRRRFVGSGHLHDGISLTDMDRVLRRMADQLFLTLYRELYFRHVYAKLEPNVDDRFQSYENICELFNLLLSESSSVGNA
jgi:hypothetical protein